MLNISITNPGRAPKNKEGQLFFLKLQEYGSLINTNLNKYGLIDLAKETKDSDFIQAAQKVNLKEIVRNANKIVIHF